MQVWVESGGKALSTSSSRLSSEILSTLMPERSLATLATAGGGCAGAPGSSSSLLRRLMSRMIFFSPLEKERGVVGSSTTSSSSTLIRPLALPRPLALLPPLCHFEMRLKSSERPEEAFRFQECGGGGSVAAAICGGAAAICSGAAAICERTTTTGEKRLSPSEARNSALQRGSATLSRDLGILRESGERDDNAPTYSRIWGNSSRICLPCRPCVPDALGPRCTSALRRQCAHEGPQRAEATARGGKEEGLGQAQGSEASRGGAGVEA